MQPGGRGDPKIRPDETPAEIAQREFARREGKSKKKESTEFYPEIADIGHRAGSEEQPRQAREK